MKAKIISLVFLLTIFYSNNFAYIVDDSYQLMTSLTFDQKTKPKRVEKDRRKRAKRKKNLEQKRKKRRKKWKKKKKNLKKKVQTKKSKKRGKRGIEGQIEARKKSTNRWLQKTRELYN